MEFDVVIVGGGLAGLALAAALRRAPLSVALVEGHLPQFPTGCDARIYAIIPANARFLDELGAWRHMDSSRMQAVSEMEVRGDEGGRIDFSAYASGAAELAWIIESSLMQRELWESARRQGNLTLLCPARPTGLGVGPEAAILELADGRHLAGRLVVGADGAESWTRNAAGIEVRFDAYGQRGVIANFETALPHLGKAFQWFRAAEGVLAWLPLPGNRMSMVWSAPDALATELLGLDAAALAARVAAAGGHRLGELSLITPPAGFPLRLMRAPTCVSPRLALVGDAAHTIHPLSGHGINLGFQDARVLGEVLAQRPPHVDCGDLSLLRRYERARREEVVMLQTATDSLHGLFASAAGPAGALRNLGLNLCNRIPVVKDLLVRYALAT